MCRALQVRPGHGITVQSRLGGLSITSRISSRVPHSQMKVAMLAIYVFLRPVLALVTSATSIRPGSNLNRVASYGWGTSQNVSKTNLNHGNVPVCSALEQSVANPDTGLP